MFIFVSVDKGSFAPAGMGIPSQRKIYTLTLDRKVQYNLYAKVAYFGVAYSDLPHLLEHMLWNIYNALRNPSCSVLYPAYNAYNMEGLNM